MSEITHTPGPWKLYPDDENGQAVVGGQHTEIATCWHHCLGSIEKQMRANARLIAAAPDLLNALENLTIAIGMGWDLDGVVDQAAAAIAKATGAAQ